ncbi:MAG TPA: methyltransferase domain-containing protein [Pyrinomonadaceae bacterium]|nr:methyltransferase domain-containing protein [Pyrinomonadaceae bacterium]
MSVPLKKLAGQSKTLIIAHRILDNWLRRRAFKSGNTVTAYGSTHEFWNLERSVSYIEQVYREYLEYAGLGPEALRGRRILEVGPGDNFGVALKFLVAGATQVVCLDKFYSERNVDQQTRIYRELRKQLSPHEARVFDEAIKLDNGIDVNPERLQYIYGHGIEKADQILEAGSFDFIVSRAVIHNVYDIDRGFEAMDRLLKPGGYMLHKIDLSDENMFSSRGMHPLTFLTIPERLYYLMASDSGKPNRKLAGDYREQMQKRGYEAKLLVSAVLGEGPLIPHKEALERGVDYSKKILTLINQIRPKLAAPYRDRSDAELATTGIFLIATKKHKKHINEI